MVGMLTSNRAIIHFFLDNFISTLPVEKYKLPISVSFFSVQSMRNLFSGKKTHDSRMYNRPYFQTD